MSIDAVNSKSISEFIRDHLPSIDWQIWTYPKNDDNYQLSLQPVSSLSNKDFEACYNLIKSTSFDHYKRSREGWNSSHKRAEMKSPDLKYLLIKKCNKLEGFMSFMPTYENGTPIIYCYEIHLFPHLQGIGLGTWIMNFLEAIAVRIPSTEKIMLTCFILNVRAMQFYVKLGFDIDPDSPLPKKLRDGTLVEYGYRILSKRVPGR